MTRRQSLISLVGLSALAALFISATPATDSAFLSHTVTRGETVSLLCIELYGRYTPAMGAVLLRDNPELKDVNIVLVGQTLKMRNPGAPAAAAATADPDVTLFVKEVAVTQGVVTYIEGTATLKPAAGGAAKPLAVNSVVVPGDAITTGAKGRVEIIINRESVVRIRENSKLVLTEFRDAGATGGSTKVNFRLGTVWTKMKKFGDKVMRFQLELPTAMAGVHGTVYQARAAADSSGEVSVFDGEVEVKGRQPSGSTGNLAPDEVAGPSEVEGPHEVSMEEWTYIIRTQQTIKIDKSGKPSAPSNFTTNPGDQWVKWNQERDLRIARIFGE